MTDGVGLHLGGFLRRGDFVVLEHRHVVGKGRAGMSSNFCNDGVETWGMVGSERE